MGLEFSLASIGSRFLALALDTLIQGVSGLILFLLAVFGAAVAHQLPADALHLGVEVRVPAHDLVEHGVELGHQPLPRLRHLREVTVPGSGHGGEQRTQI